MAENAAELLREAAEALPAREGPRRNKYKRRMEQRQQQIRVGKAYACFVWMDSMYMVPGGMILINTHLAPPPLVYVE